MPDTMIASPLRHIVVATDLSANAAVALRWAQSIALEHGADIALVHAVESVALPYVPLAVQNLVAQRLADLESQVRTAGVNVTSRYSAGHAWELVAATVDELGADLVIVGARGQTSYALAMLGSTADRIVRTSTAPVLTVHEHARPPQAMRTVLVATDFSAEARFAAAEALRLLRGAAGNGAAGHRDEYRVVLLHAWQPCVEYGFDLSSPLTAPLGDLEGEAREELEPLARELRADGWNVDVDVRQGYAASVITRTARRVNADLITVGTHGRGALGGILLGSVAERVLHHAPCPVLTVRQHTVSASGGRSHLDLRS